MDSSSKATAGKPRRHLFFVACESLGQKQPVISAASDMWGHGEDLSLLGAGEDECKLALLGTRGPTVCQVPGKLLHLFCTQPLLDLILNFTF